MSTLFLKKFQKSSVFLVFPLFTSHILSPFVQFAKQPALYYSVLMKCYLCPRKCGADRSISTGFCKVGYDPVVNIYKLHYGEEPLISGSRGSGTVFFSGCNLGCIFCQNHDISFTGKGTTYTPSGLADIYRDLESQGAHNINLVTPMHFAPSVAESLKLSNLSIPVAVNTGSYDSVESLRMLDGLVDIYMPDFKYMSSELSAKYSKASDYPEVAKAAIAEMYSQTGPVVMGDDGLMKKGVLVRHLVLPGAVSDSKKVLRYLHDTYGENILLSIMNQYTPMPSVASHEFLGRKVTEEEYSRVVDFADKIGIEKGFVQEGEAVSESFIPNWDLEGF